MLLDNYAYSNRLKDVHPGEKLCFALITMIIGFVPNIYSSLFIITMMALMTIFVAKIPAKVYVKLMIVPLFFLGTSLLTIMISIDIKSEAAWMVLPFLSTNIGITYDSLQVAGFTFLRSMALVSCLYFISLTTPILDLITILKRARVPSILTDLMLLIYRYLFVLMSTANQIFTSQDSRLGYSTFKRSTKSLGKLISGLLIKSCSDAEKLYLALSSRGYDEELKVLEHSFTISSINILLIIAIESLLLFIAFKIGR